MSTPYPPAGGGQQPPGPYGAPGPSSWGPGSGGQPYGGPGAPGPGYGGFGGPGGGSQGYGAGPGQQGSGQSGPGQSGSGQYGPGQYGPGPQGPGQYGPGPQGGGQQGPGGSPYGAPAQKAPKPPKAPGKPVDLGRILPLALAALGLLAFIFGFLHALTIGDDSLGAVKYSVYQVQGWLPILLVVVGLLGVAPLLPGGKKYTLPTALLSIAGLLGAITALTSGVSASGSSVSRGAGLILLLIVALLQAAIAVYAWLTESGAIKPATANFGSGSSSSGSGKPGSGGAGPGQLPPVFVPSGGQPGTQPSSGDRNTGSYPPGGFGVSQGPAPEAGGYGGYQPTGYRPSGTPGDTYGGAQPAGGESTGSPYSPQSGGGERPEAYGAQSTTGHGDAPGRQESGDKLRQGDEPPPDVTQQVRF